MAIETPDTVTPDTTIATPATAPARSRRVLLAAALGGLGGLFASRLGAPGPAAAAAGDPLIIGNTGNNAGTANTRLTTASTGTALLVTQNGSGTALRGSAVGAGSIAGFFTAANGTGISGVTGNPNSYGVFGSNDDAAAGTGGAVRADGNANHGLVASTDSATKAALKATNSAVDGTVALFENTSGGTGTAAGPAIRAYTGGGSNANVHPGGGYADAAGEFAGPIGVIGAAADSGGIGVVGLSTNNAAVYGVSTDHVGVFGFSPGGTGVRGEGSDYAGYFAGLLHADSVSANVKAFRIDHPQDPANKVLEHSCVESNERKLVYDGVVTTDADGEASIELPAYFDALNRDVRYQLTPLADARSWVSREISGNRFTLATSEPNTKVSWQVTGIRQDAYAKAHPLVVESAKTGKEKGRYLNPIEHGQPESKGVGYELRAATRRDASPAT